MALLCEKERCTGCTACASVCPVNCITMEPDGEGFLRPVVDESRCVGCGRCGTVCPPLNPLVGHGQPRAFAAKHREEATRALSTSGGVFTLLAEHVLQLGGVVFGAAWDADFNVVHTMAQCPEDLPALRGAKYAQSRLGDSFRRVKEQLELGRDVLFSGTPCQIAGLRSYLGKEYINLWLVDVVCHGVPSPAVWSHYLRYRGEQVADGQRPVTVNLRCKDTGWAGYSVDIRWPYGRNYMASNREDSYIRAFVGDLCLRPSCHQCVCKGLDRPADFTLGDYWGVWDQMPAMNDNKGTSIVLVHSEKAKALWEVLAPGMTVKEANADRCMEQNPAALRPAPDNPNRKSFLARYAVEDFDLLVNELAPKAAAPSLARRVAGKLKRMLKI